MIGKHKKDNCLMTKRAFTLVEVLIIVAIIALLTTIAIPNLLSARMNANDVMAQATLKAIAKAMEHYMIANQGYPTDAAELTTGTPPYINVDYFTGTRSGFTYTNTLAPGGYTISAEPVTVGYSGSTTYTITTGAAFLNN